MFWHEVLHQQLSANTRNRIFRLEVSVFTVVREQHTVGAGSAGVSSAAAFVVAARRASVPEALCNTASGH
jgi:hypothetical protein